MGSAITTHGRRGPTSQGEATRCGRGASTLGGARGPGGRTGAAHAATSTARRRAKTGPGIVAGPTAALPVRGPPTRSLSAEGLSLRPTGPCKARGRGRAGPLVRPTRVATRGRPTGRAFLGPAPVRGPHVSMRAPTATALDAAACFRPRRVVSATGHPSRVAAPTPPARATSHGASRATPHRLRAAAAATITPVRSARGASATTSYGPVASAITLAVGGTAITTMDGARSGLIAEARPRLSTTPGVKPNNLPVRHRRSTGSRSKVRGATRQGLRGAPPLPRGSQGISPCTRGLEA